METMDDLENKYPGKEYSEYELYSPHYPKPALPLPLDFLALQTEH